MSEMASHMKEFGFNEKALKYFRKALDDFSISKNAIDKSKTKELIADLMFEMDMEEATNYYQTLLDENLVPEKLIYGKAEKYLIQLVICLLSNDDGVEAMVQLNDFPKQSQMIEVLKNIVQAYNDRDAGKFVNAIKDGEDIKRWNNQQVSKLLSIKKRIEPEEISLC
jgi:hemerythrin superfamily protein